MTEAGQLEIPVSRARELVLGSTDDVAVVDVRTEAEFAEGHIPGAVNLRLVDLVHRIGELDRHRTTITVCRNGLRGAAAAAILRGSGFREVHNLQGGFDAWNGTTVKGGPVDAMRWFEGAGNLAEYVARAVDWEQSAVEFYREAAKAAMDSAAQRMFEKLAVEEGQHRDALLLLGPARGTGARRMEGGAALDDVLRWIRGRSPGEVLELAVALEATAWDSYLQVSRTAAESDVRTFFADLAEGERLHLVGLADAFDSWLVEVPNPRPPRRDAGR